MYRILLRQDECGENTQDKSADTVRVRETEIKIAKFTITPYYKPIRGAYTMYQILLNSSDRNTMESSAM